MGAGGGRGNAMTAVRKLVRVLALRRAVSLRLSLLILKLAVRVRLSRSELRGDAVSSVVPSHQSSRRIQHSSSVEVSPILTFPSLQLRASTRLSAQRISIATRFPS